MTFEIGVTSPELQIRVQQQQKKEDYFWTEFANYHKEYVKPAFQKERATEMLSREYFVQNTDRKVAKKAHYSCWWQTPLNWQTAVYNQRKDKLRHSVNYSSKMDLVLYRINVL